MKILVVTYSYLPHTSPRSLRWSSILEAWVRSGHEIEVISGHASAEGAEFSVNGVKVFAAGQVNRFRSQANSGSHPVGVKALALKLARSIYGLTWRNIQWPDYACLWIRPAVAKTVSRVEQFRPDCLISVSHPFSGHMVGRAIKQKYPDLPWYVDIGDPFAFLEQVKVNNPWLYGRLNQKVEKSILRRAQGVSVTTEGTRKKYLPWSKDLAEKIRVMPPVLRGNPEDFWRPTALASGGAQKWIFLGTLYPGLRSPTKMLSFFADYAQRYPQDRISLHIVGEYRQCHDEIKKYAKLLGERLVLQGQVPESESRRLLLAADGLVHIGNHTPMQLPSKVVEYAATGKRILNFYSIEEDSSLQFFNSHPRVWQLGPNDTGDEIMGKIHLGESEDLADKPATMRFVQDFSRDHVAGQYLEHIRSIL